MNDTPAFRVVPVDYASGVEALRAVRDRVFVEEQQVPPELEHDAIDPECVHVIAFDQHYRPIGTGRLTPERRIGRMAVLREWRGRGVGDAMLAALTRIARERGWRELALNAQVAAAGFYARHGYLPVGTRFVEAGIEHQAMRRKLDGASAIEHHDAAVAIVTAIASQSRRGLRIYSRELDPGLFDAPEVLDALRRFATRGPGAEIRVLLQEPGIPQRDHAPLLALGQRLPSVLLFRAVDDPVDRAYPSAFVANDAGGHYFRSLGHRFDGEADLDAPGRTRQLREHFDRVWERSRPCTEFRALGL